ncbi:MAG: GC-type dockerin domain-anchored protein [Planctomycetota bacterium]
MAPRMPVAVFAISTLVACPASAPAQCSPDWDAAIGQPGLDRGVRRGLAALDEGGPLLIASGAFSSAGGVAVGGVAAWTPDDGWRSFGGSGLTRGGSIVGANAIAVFDGELYAGGRFTEAGGEAIEGVARFDGDRWHPLGGGIDGQVLGMRAVDFQGRDLLILCGTFTTVFQPGGAGENSPAVAGWDGTAWVALGGNLIGSANDAIVWDDGAGDALYATGAFDVDGGRGLARYDGSEAWEVVGDGFSGGTNPRGNTLAVYDDRRANALFVGGNFADARPLSGPPPLNVVRWDGDNFEAVRDGFDNTVSSLLVADAGDGERLYAGGTFFLSGSDAVSGIAVLGSTAWEPLGLGIAGGSVPGIGGMAASPFGDGLFVAGGFSLAGDDEANNIARWGCGSVACPPDLDGDGELTLFDFLAFQNLFTDGDPRADFDGDGELTLFDFLAFQNAFDAGCE